MQTPSKIHAFLAALLGSDRAASMTITASNTAPPAIVAFQLMGFSLNEWSVLLGIFFTLCLIVNQFYKLARWGWSIYRHYRARQMLLSKLLPGSTTTDAAAAPTIVGFRQEEPIP